MSVTSDIMNFIKMTDSEELCSHIVADGIVEISEVALITNFVDLDYVSPEKVLSIKPYEALVSGIIAA